MTFTGLIMYITTLKSVTKWVFSIDPSLKSLIGKSELLIVYKAFVHSSTQYCSALWACAVASHLFLLDSVESKFLKIIGISHDEGEAQGLFLSHCRQIP